MNVENLKIGDSICDMHYGQTNPPRLPADSAQPWEIVRSISFKPMTVGDQDPCQPYYNLIESKAGHGYSNKMLTIIDIAQDGTLIAMFVYDGNRVGILQLRRKE